MKKIIRSFSSIQIVLFCFMFVIIIGSILLSLPVSSANGKAVSYIDALFTATTSTCVTGLVTVPTATTWSIFGQVVILIMIQIGGLGVITVVSGIMIALRRKVSLEDRMLIGDSLNLKSLEGMVRFVKKIISITFAIEGAGALLYMTVFIPEFGIKGVWISVFNSVSAFCNAGMDIIGENSLCDYAFNPLVNITTMLLIIYGGIGFVVFWDFEKLIKSRKRKKLCFLSLHTKIVLSVTLFFIISGAVLFFIFEYNNPNTIKNCSLSEKIMLSLFQSVTTRTAGFQTFPQESFTNASSFVSMLLMFVGGSPIGTAGGIKTVTVFVLFACATSVIRNKRTVDVFGRQISADVIKKSVAVFATSFFIVIVSTVTLAAVSGGGVLDIMYETVSATATVGLSRSFTPALNLAGKICVIVTMYLGRVGPISLAFAFSTNKSKENIITNPVEEINIG